MADKRKLKTPSKQLAHQRRYGRKESSKIRVREYNTRLNVRFRRFSKSYSKTTGLQVLMTFDEWCSLIKDGTCFYCAGPLDKTGSNLDRINNENFYAVSNSVPCCVRCNKVKGKLLDFETMKEVGQILKRREGR